jgi:hypothetical protein
MTKRPCHWLKLVTRSLSFLQEMLADCRDFDADVR